MVGQVQVVVPTPANTLLDLMRFFDLGYDEITSANPGVSVWLPARSPRVVIPRQFILPAKPWTGIVINIPQLRLYYFPAAPAGEASQVITYPVSIAREGWATPLGSTTITAKYRDPGWFVPQSIRDEHLRENGVELPEYFPPGADNPMGMLAMRTGFAGIFIHGTNRPWGVGMRTSHGCLHLYPEDAAELFALVRPGTPVRVIDQPFLVGNDGGRWVMASFRPVDEYPGTFPPFTRALQAIVTGFATVAGGAAKRAEISWARVRRLADTPQSVPIAVTVDQPDVSEWLAAIPVERYDYAPFGVDANDARIPDKPARAAVRNSTMRGALSSK